MNLIWIGVFFLIGGCYTQSMAVPRSATESGSKHLLNSYAVVAPSFQIIQYDNYLARANTYTTNEGGWLAVVACDHYYLAVANGDSSMLALHLFTPFNSTTRDINHIIAFSNITTAGGWYSFISVAPSGTNFVFLNGSHLLVFEVDLQTFSSTITVEKPIDDYIHTMRGRLVMSDSKISFIFNTTDQYIYDYKSHETTERTLPSAWQINAYDTYDDYWVYASNKDILLEDPTGNLHVFNYTEVIMVERVLILPPQLRVSPDSIDVALISGYVTLGTLNAMTGQFDKYSSVPSKSIALGYQQGIVDGQHEGLLLNFVVGHSAILYELYDNGRTIGMAVPAQPGNHSCSMRNGERLSTFWCGNGGTDPTNFCPAGTYQPSRGFASCLLCPEGTYQPNQGSVTCLPCNDKQYCPLGTFQPQTIDPNSVRQESWTFPVSETVTSFEEVLLMLMFASSLSNIAIVLWGLFGITAALILSLLLKYFTGINVHKWLAKIDIHKKTRYKARPKPDGGFKIEPVKVESVFGGYLTLLAAYILLVGLITTISYVRDYHPLLIGQDQSMNPSENSARESLVQDYNTQSEASYLANVIKNNLSMNVTIHMYNFQSFVFPGNDPLARAMIQNCYNQFGDECEIGTGERLKNSTGDIKVLMNGPLRFTEAELDITTSFDSYFTFAIVEISVALRENNMTGIFQPSTAKYLVLPGKDRVITGVLLVPIIMTVVVRDTELPDEDFNRVGYMSFVSDESKLQNMGHSVQTFEKTLVSPSFEFQLTIDNNWRLESEQRRFSGVGAFFAALLAILGLYEVTLLASELAHRIFHAIEKRHKKRSKYENIEDPTSVLIVNEKAE